MVFYIVYRASKECRGKGLISKQLESLGCRRVYGSFWEVNERRMNEVLRIVGENKAILLRRTRDVRKPKYDDEGNIVDLGSLIVLAYNPENDGNSRVKWLLARAPYIRLCRSVYAFPQNSGQYGRGNIFGVSNLIAVIREHNKNAKIFSRIVIVNSSEAMGFIVERVKLRIKRRAEKILDGYKSLMNAFLSGQLEKRQLIEKERRLYEEFKHLRRLAVFYEKWLKIDLVRETMKVYSAMRKVRLLKENQIHPIFHQK